MLHDGDRPVLTQRGVPSVSQLNSLESVGNLLRYDPRMIEEVATFPLVGGLLGPLQCGSRPKEFAFMWQRYKTG